MTSQSTSVTREGFFYAIAAYGSWGFVPLYWKSLRHVPPLEIMAHRVVWSLLVFLVIIAQRRQLAQLVLAMKSRAERSIYIYTALLIGTNWLIYIYAVNSGHAVESSLGYFINPLVNVFLGMAFLKEKMRSLQWLAIAIAAIGVTSLTVQAGKIPWIALSLAVTFGLYGLLRKQAPLPSLIGSGLESTVLFLPATCYLAWLGYENQGAFEHANFSTWGLLALGGVVTGLPLLWFSEAAKRLPLSTLGFMQYIAPTLQLLSAVLVFKEPFTRAHMVSFGLIWSALIIFTIDTRIKARSTRARAALG